MQAQEVEYVWSQSDALNEWLIRKVILRNHQIAVLICLMVAFVSTIQIGLSFEGGLAAAMSYFFLLSCCYCLPIVLSFLHRRWVLRKQGVEYRLNSRGIYGKWSEWFAYTIPWQSLTAFRVEPLDKSSGFYRIRVFTRLGRSIKLYVDEEQMPYVVQLLARQNLSRKASIDSA